MKKFAIFALFCFIAACFSQSDVIDLTAENFDQETANFGLALVEFYAPWCGHCKKLAPEYEVAATELKADGIILAKIDASAEENAPVAQKFGIRGFPTLKIFRSGAVASDFNGGRTSAEIVAYMRKQNQPAITKVSSTEELDAFTQKNKVAVVGFFSSESSEEYKSFETVANKLRDTHSFAVVFDSAISTGAQAEVPSVILFKQFDDLKNVLEGSKMAELETFVAQNSMPWVDEIGAHNYATYSQSGKPVGFMFVTITDKDQYSWVQNLAKESRNRISWVFIDHEKFGRYGERIGLSGKTNPSFAIEDFGTGLHYALDESLPVSEETVKKLVDSFLAGTLEATIRSEEIPATNDEPVKVLVAKNFQSMVLDSDKDVLVEFYAPWCGHCKTLAPIYEELAQSLAHVNTLVIAKMDATANDVDRKYNVQGFPTLKFFKAGQKDTPMDYDGGRTKDAFIDFLKANAAHSFEVTAVEGKDEL
jgi:protein disulfide-isomerase A1